LLAHVRWFSPGTLASSTAKNGRHDIAEILLKVALKHQIKNQKSIMLTTNLFLLLASICDLLYNYTHTYTLSYATISLH
jgi:hypothetical protein